LQRGFKDGAKKHLLGIDSLPEWLPAKEEALEIYEEVLAALPHSELAAQSFIWQSTSSYLLQEVLKQVLRRIRT
jgi:hypothetical protein